MKISYQLFLPLLCLIGTASLYSMEEDNFDITIYNNLKGETAFINIPVEVTYTKGKTEASSVIQGANILDLGSYQSLKADTQLIFEGYGGSYEGAITKSTLDKETLLKKWREKKESDKDKLVITLTTEGWIRPYSIAFSYSNEIPKKIEEKIKVYEQAGNPFLVFPRIRHWKLQDILTEDAVRNAKSWKEELVPGGIFQRATTAEDVYRYILGLPKDYTKGSIDKSFKKLSLKWHPDKVKEEDKEFANRVFLLVQKAQEGLLEALKEKGQ